MSSELDGDARIYYPRCKAFLDILLDGYAEGDGLGSPDQPMHVEIFPKTATIHNNAYHQPDGWELTFDARDCPFDPALLRAATVQITLFDYGEMEPQGGDIGEGGVWRSEPDIIGLLDEDSMEMSPDGRWITMQGQDMTTLFSGKQWAPLPGGRARRIPTGMRLDWFVNDRIRECDDTGRMQVSFEGTLSASDMPTVGKNDPAGHGRGVPVKQDTTYWDVIYNTVVHHGFVCYVRGWNVVIAKPKNLEDFRHADIVQMEWGNNIESVTLQRKLGKNKTPTIIVMAYDGKGQVRTDPIMWPASAEPVHVLSGKVSDKTKSVTKSTIKGTTAQKPARATGHAKIPKATVVKKDEQFQIVPVFWTWDKAVLARIAQSLYTLISRGERRIIVKTHDLTDIYGKALLHLMPGDAAEIHWQDFNHETMRAMSPEQRLLFLKAKGYQDIVAQTLSIAYDKLRDKQNPPLRIREITKVWNVESEGGLSLEMELVDFAVTGLSKSPPLDSVGASTFDAAKFLTEKNGMAGWIENLGVTP